MRRFIPELEIQIQKTRCDYLKFEEESIPCLIVDFTLSKYPLTEYTIHSIEVTLKRSEESYAFDCFYTSKPLKNIRLTSKKSDTQSAIIKASDLPFQGFQPDDKLFFSIEYSNDSDEKPKKRSVTFIHRDSEWEIYGNTCDKIQNSHYTSFVLPVFEKNNVTVTLTGIAYDFEKTSYYFSIANYSEIPIKLYSIEYYISVIRNGQIRTYDNCNDIPISEVDAHSTKVGIMEIGNRPTEEFDYDLMTELDNDTKIKATASIGLSVEFNDGDDHEFSDWIVSELSTKPSMPILDEEPFEYSEHIKVKPSTVLSYADFIVFSYAFNCLNNHDTEMVNRTRYMKCPKCNQRSWQKKVITKE